MEAVSGARGRPFGSHGGQGGGLRRADLVRVPLRLPHPARNPLDLRVALAYRRSSSAAPAPSTAAGLRHLAVWWLLYSADAVTALARRSLESLGDGASGGNAVAEAPIRAPVAVGQRDPVEDGRNEHPREDSLAR